jgi:hypothetical protein
LYDFSNESTEAPTSSCEFRRAIFGKEHKPITAGFEQRPDIVVQNEVLEKKETDSIMVPMVRVGAKGVCAVMRKGRMEAREGFI